MTKQRLIASLMILIPLIAHAQTTLNLVDDPGFENGKWNLWQNSSISSTNCRSGKCLAAGPGAARSSLNVRSKLQAGETYELSAYVRLGSAHDEFLLRVRFKDAAKKEFAGCAAEAKPLSGYQKINVTFKAPKFADAYIDFLKTASKSKDFADDVSLVKLLKSVPVPPTQPPPVTQPINPAGVTLPFQSVAPVQTLYVATHGNDNAQGTEKAPLQTIAAAVKKAKPGTAIMVRAGIYNGSVNFSNLHGTKDKPIIVMSADGPGKARIVGGSTKAAVSAYKISYVGIYGFHVQANTSEAAGDVGGFKIWGSWDEPAENLLIAGNLITGRGADGFKLFGGAKNCLIIGNIIDGNWYQEAIDNVSVENTTYAFNTIRGKARNTGITMKAGSRNMQLFGNLFDIETNAGIFIGGFGNSRLHRSFPNYWKGFEAKNINVHHNVVTAKMNRSAAFIGANNSILDQNYLAKTVGSSAHALLGHFTYNSFNNKITNNSVTRAHFFDPNAGQNKGYILEGNRISEQKPAVGAESTEAHRFLDLIGQ